MPASLSDLLQGLDLDDPEEVIKKCNAALKKSKTDVEAQHHKVVALIKQDRYEDVLRVLADGGDKLKKQAALEHAYALYKTGELEEAEKISKEIEGHRGAKHVEAQANYRAEDFGRAAEIYEELLKDPRDEDSDLRINKGAVDAQLEWQGKGELVEKKKATREDLEAFERAYNAACGCISRVEFVQAEILLKRAKALCTALDDLTDDEKTAELLPMQVQELLVLTRLNKKEEAEKLASSITLPSIPDASTRIIAQNNILASTKLTNPYLSHRLFNSTPTLPKSDYLFTYQISLRALNAYVFDLLASKPSAVTKATSKYLSTHPVPALDPTTNCMSILNAAANLASHPPHPQTSQQQSTPNPVKAAIKFLQHLLSQRPLDLGLRLTLIQLYITSTPTNLTSAISTLETFFALLSSSPDPDPQIINSPTLTALLTSLYGLQNRQNAISNTLFKTCSYWLDEPTTSSTSPQSIIRLLQHAGPILLTSPNPSHTALATKLFSFLSTQDPTSPFAKIGTIASSPHPSTSKDLSILTPLETLLKDTPSPATLEDAGIPNFVSAPLASLKRSAPTNAASAPQKKRVRKNRIPKAAEEGRKADPERWLPLHDRSGWRPKKGKKGRRGQEEKSKDAGGMQGGVVEEKVEAPKVSGGGGGGGKKKKGKGRK
ncbi:MAG: Signal recognition particle core component [Cirrosporium novae-zelandiae]|nr:MAG: Signal recognition particle core component [Cirrosporium novae-zelandiae]